MGRGYAKKLEAQGLFTMGDILVVPLQHGIDGPAETARLYLPAPEQQIIRTLRRIGIPDNDAA